MSSRLLKIVRSALKEPQEVPVPDNVVHLPTPLSRLEQEFLPAALEIEETPPSPIKRGVMWSIVALTAVAIVWASIGQIDVVATAPGKVTPDGKIKVLQSMDNAIIRAIHVKEGQQVKQGDLLVELDPAISAADLNSSSEKTTLLEMELARLNAELSGKKAERAVPGATAEMSMMQESLRVAKEGNYNAKLAQARNNMQAKEMVLAAAQDTQRKLEETTQTARFKEARIRPFVGQVMSRFDYLKLKDDLAQNQHDLEAQIHHVQEAREGKEAAEQQILQIQQERRIQIITEINEKTSTYAGLKGDVIKAKQYVNQKELRAPSDGQVQSLSVTTTGGVVTPAQTIATIVPMNTQLVVEAMLSNEDVGFVKVGQTVEIKVDTFPFQKYGTIKGTVLTISPDSEERQAPQGKADTTTPTKAGLMYKVRIRPEKTALNINGTMQPISSGMTVQADINTDRRRIIDFFLSPVMKYWDEGMKVR